MIKLWKERADAVADERRRDEAKRLAAVTKTYPLRKSHRPHTTQDLLKQPEPSAFDGIERSVLYDYQKTAFANAVGTPLTEETLKAAMKEMLVAKPTRFASPKVWRELKKRGAP